ncbi:hypothetical protein ASG87_03400 [Frateuria sp. Soil773]|uniref:DUF998 domain-containing protein n=1 Tax=Frateuria sp. Soil773 TaxID=1736407 RepID=UPI0006FE80B8|nr:DUF998 domain-containing protein [Frateuria sp. Soil773]KRE89399.1 hypothetical protein ASG87_03400 [Frateuria sp. Soil773]
MLSADDHDRLARTCGSAATAGIVLFALACGAVQFLRPDLDWLRAPLSFYLLGRCGAVVQSVYVALAAALVLLGTGYYRALPRTARSAAPLLLFAVGAVALCVTAFEHSNLPQGVPTLEGYVHGVAAQTAFLCTGTAMLLQAWRLRADPRWRPRFAFAFGYAALCFAALWVQAGWHGAPRGLTQKLLIALILGWLLLAARWLRRGPPAMAGSGA